MPRRSTMSQSDQLFEGLPEETPDIPAGSASRALCPHRGPAQPGPSGAHRRRRDRRGARNRGRPDSACQSRSSARAGCLSHSGELSPRHQIAPCAISSRVSPSTRSTSRRALCSKRAACISSPSLEHLNLRSTVAGFANPKSSTGRLDVFTRLIADYQDSFDSVGEGYSGPLFAEICPRTFSIKVRYWLAPQPDPLPPPRQPAGGRRAARTRGRQAFARYPLRRWASGGRGCDPRRA